VRGRGVVVWGIQAEKTVGDSKNGRAHQHALPSTLQLPCITAPWARAQRQRCDRECIQFLAVCEARRAGLVPGLELTRLVPLGWLVPCPRSKAQKAASSLSKQVSQAGSAKASAAPIAPQQSQSEGGGPKKRKGLRAKAELKVSFSPPPSRRSSPEMSVALIRFVLGLSTPLQKSDK
jgi:hypothetical protein